MTYRLKVFKAPARGTPDYNKVVNAIRSQTGMPVMEVVDCMKGIRLIENVHHFPKGWSGNELRFPLTKADAYILKAVLNNTFGCEVEFAGPPGTLSLRYGDEEEVF